jgi:hypothetical protein
LYPSHHTDDILVLARPKVATTSTATQISALGRRIDELFIAQASRFTFHNDDTQNEYRNQESRLSSLMLDKSLSNEKHVEYAQEIINRSESYKQNFVKPLRNLTEEIHQGLLSFDGLLRAAEQTPDHPKLERWFSFSNALHEARVMAVDSIESQVEFDTYIPKIIVQNGGNADQNLSSEQTKEMSEGMVGYAALMKVSFETNQKIQQEREPLTKELFLVEEELPHQASATAKTVVKIHPLEGKSWFRLLKVLYVAAWIVGFGVVAAFAYGVGEIAVFIVGGIVLSVSLVALRSVFYYVLLGRATAMEQPGQGFMDLEELKNDLAGVQANNPELYRDVVSPFFESWKQRYGRRVPIHEMEVLQKRIATEIDEIKEKRQKLIDNAANKGVTIELSVLRKNLEKTKSDYRGPNREAYIGQIDRFLTSLEVKYGASIPVDEANKLLESLDDDIRNQEKKPGS